jgi:hypothetical protein
MNDSVETPWQVRYVRWWWTREARRHWDASRDLREKYPRARRAQMTVCLLYAQGARPFWLKTGQVPIVGLSRAEAISEMAA